MTTRVAFALCLFLAACGAGAGGSTTPSSQALTPLRLYPLADGHIWSYDVDTGTGMSTLAIARVSRRADGRFDVNTGSEPNVYEVTPEGIKRASGTWLLRMPFEVNASWDLGGGRRAEITSVDASVETPAGNYAHCVEVAERGGAGAQIRTIFCPDVGPVFVESSTEIAITHTTLRVTARLRGYSDGTDL